MKDKLKDFVTENRMDFDIYKEDYGALWDKIESGLDTNKKRRRFGLSTTYFKVAASVVLVLCIGFLYLKLKYSSTGFDQEVRLEQISSELAEADLYYGSLINEKIQLIQASKEDIDPDIFNDLNLLDEAYNELKEDLKDNADNEEVVSAMIQNYRIKLKLLETILEEIKENEEEKKNEQINI
ncbi:hypothetical protein QQ008_10165 [Fulvivirgaceae bacterium BMA10]|uniref:Anti-sigma factor n=1 Tax=Splendidivirga corallicola TaxID=3051826 RepID=A0ABT8KLX8_9BACT|nr:hypothetical protein [Fulvivirgaceae bacterium BMA10]